MQINSKEFLNHRSRRESERPVMAMPRMRFAPHSLTFSHIPPYLPAVLPAPPAVVPSLDPPADAVA